MNEPHHFADRILRKALRDPQNLRDLVRAAAGDLARGLDFDDVVFDDREFTLPDLARREADILCQVPVREGDRETSALVCVLVEHQSQSEVAMPLRMLLYTALHWDRISHQRTDSKRGVSLPVVLPIVFHTGLLCWNAARTLAGLFNPPERLRVLVPAWPILFWDLAEQSAAGLLSDASAWLQSLAVLRAEHEDQRTFATVFEAVAHGLERSPELDDERHANLLELILSWAVCRRPKPERGLLLELATRHAPPQHRQRVKTMGDKLGQTMEEWAQERYERGLIEGRVEGRVDELRALLRAFLERRFGPVSSELGLRIDAATDDGRLRASLERVWDLASPDELEL